MKFRFSFLALIFLCVGLHAGAQKKVVQKKTTVGSKVVKKPVTKFLNQTGTYKINGKTFRDYHRLGHYGSQTL